MIVTQKHEEYKIIQLSSAPNWREPRLFLEKLFFSMFGLLNSQDWEKSHLIIKFICNLLVYKLLKTEIFTRAPLNWHQLSTVGRGSLITPEWVGLLSWSAVGISVQDTFLQEFLWLQIWPVCLASVDLCEILLVTRFYFVLSTFLEHWPTH
jgi:hypothetical protein